MKTIAAGKFKATCLAVLDEVQSKRETVVVTKNGTPVAQLVPMPSRRARSALWLLPWKARDRWGHGGPDLRYEEDEFESLRNR